jgi:hypothetical protein
MDQKQTPPQSSSTITRICPNTKCSGGIICWGEALYECPLCADAKKAASNSAH